MKTNTSHFMDSELFPSVYSVIRNAFKSDSNGFVVSFRSQPSGGEYLSGQTLLDWRPMDHNDEDLRQDKFDEPAKNFQDVGAQTHVLNCPQTANYWRIYF